MHYANWSSALLTQLKIHPRYHIDSDLLFALTKKRDTELLRCQRPAGSVRSWYRHICPIPPTKLTYWGLWGYKLYATLRGSILKHALVFPLFSLPSTYSRLIFLSVSFLLLSPYFLIFSRFFLTRLYLFQFPGQECLLRLEILTKSSLHFLSPYCICIFLDSYTLILLFFRTATYGSADIFLTGSFFFSSSIIFYSWLIKKEYGCTKIRSHNEIYTLRKKCYWIKSISFQKHVYHGFKSICYRISNIFIDSCSIFLWINSMHVFGKKCFWFNSILFSVDSNQYIIELITYLLIVYFYKSIVYMLLAEML